MHEILNQASRVFENLKDWNTLTLQCQHSSKQTFLMLKTKDCIGLHGEIIAQMNLLQ